MSWDTFTEEAKRKGSASEDYIRLKDGESVEGVFVGEPYFYYGAFKDRTEYPEWQEGLSFKFKINFVTHDNGQLVPKIVQGGRRLANAIVTVKEEYGLDNVFKIARAGSGKDDTTYAVLFKGKIPDAIKAKLKDVELKKLQFKKAETEEESFPPAEEGF